ncbi:MAG: phage major capsid protein [Clostridium sp.]|uniref:phage major capsid protein n=1 Tax=Clostridium sp. TaxID=1506 RepID=UPI0025C5170D|nr:phage major capsid protein [Clostridium sp.]MCI9304015.1 phage major capsid protein [Clostridium sp.]
MNLKALKEKRSKLLNELEAMIPENETEARTLTTEEIATFDEKHSEIKAIDETITRIEEVRAKELGKEEEYKEEKNAEEVEKRALENFFRGKDLIGEERALLASANTALMPLEISKTIIKKLEETCPVLEMAKRFSSKGTLRLILEDTYGNAAITPENTSFHDSEVAFQTVELRAYKISTSVQATFELLQNSEIDLSNYLLDVIVRRLSRELNKLFITGSGTNQPQGLDKATNTYEFTNAALTIQDFIMMQTAIHPTYLENACWIVNRETFQMMASLLDSMGRPYMVTNVIQDKVVYTLLGLRVIVDVNVAKKTVIMANIAEAYSINILTDISVKHLTEISYTSGVEVYAGYCMADGKIVNQDAIVIGKQAAGKSAKK